MHPLCKILNTPVMSLCLVKQNDRTWVEKHQLFLFNVYKLFFIFDVFTLFNVFYFFLERFFLHLWTLLQPARAQCIGLSERFFIIIEKCLDDRSDELLCTLVLQLCEDLFNRIKDDDSGDTLYSVEVSQL